MSLVTARAVLLRSHPYGESSRVLRFLTDRRGLVALMAKGVRRARGGGEGLGAFAEGMLTFYVKESRELQTFKEFGVINPRTGLGRDPVRLTAASVLADLVLRQGGEAGSDTLFDTVSRGFDALSEAPAGGVPAVLLREGWSLVSSLGYHPELDVCVECGATFGPDEIGRMDFAQGGLRCARCSGASASGAGPRIGPGARGQLRTLLRGAVPDPLSRPRVHLQLLSDFITYHVAGSRPLDAFRILATLLPPDDA